LGSPGRGVQKNLPGAQRRPKRKGKKRGKKKKGKPPVSTRGSAPAKFRFCGGANLKWASRRDREKKTTKKSSNHMGALTKKIKVRSLAGNEMLDQEDD